MGVCRVGRSWASSCGRAAAALGPADVGLPPTRRRRTPGLRRQEVALLAGVSTSWYTWLEQGRPINASRSVLDALARTLRLSAAEHTHLLALVHPAAASDAVTPSDDCPEALLRLIATFAPGPAYVLNGCWDYMAWNEPQRRLFPELAALAPQQRNLLWVLFMLPSVRSLIVDWAGEAARSVAQFRSDTERLQAHPRWQALTVELLGESPEFAAQWSRYDIAAFAPRLRRYQHPRAGLLAFEYQQLIAAESPDLRVVLQLPIAHDDSAQRLAAWHDVG